MRSSIVVFAAAAIAASSLFGNARADTGLSDDREARALIDRWLQAQNGSDFAAYAALYARSFHGVRRSGPRMVDLDRGGWMRDRGRMFKRPMKVEIAELATRAVGEGREAIFVQTWSSGRYRDVGRKRMVLVREEGALRIGREEMIESKIDSPSPPSPTPAAPAATTPPGVAASSGAAAPVRDDAQDAILRALYPRFDPRTRRTDPDGLTTVGAVIVKPRGGGAEQVALVVLEQEGKPVEREVAVLARRAGRLAVLARATANADARERFELDPEHLALGPGEAAIAVLTRVTSDENGPRNGEHVETRVALLRRVGAELIALVELTTFEDHGDAECGGRRDATLAVRAPARTRAALPDLVLTVEDEREEFTVRGGGRCIRRTRSLKRIYRWQDGGYETRPELPAFDAGWR